MSRKRIEVVELNKKDEKIILEEKQSALILFWRRHGLLIFLTLLILSLTILGISLVIAFKNFRNSEEPTIKETSVDISLDNYEALVAKDALTEETAKKSFLNNGKFKSNGEVLLVKKVENSKYTIKYYSDGTAIKIMKDGSKAIRINPLSDGSYGISNDGVISSKAETSDITITSTKEYPWGTVNFFSDGSAEVFNSKIDLFVRNANDVNDNYISNNKVTYLKETKNVGNIKLNYYYDGTIEIVKDNKSYLVRTKEDLNITANDVTFKNNNQASIYETKTMSDGIVIDYYDDGGAIIKDGSKTLSVRKSNSIIIKDNKIFEIVDNIYVDECKQIGNVTYYTNGSAVVNNYQGNTLYVPENSDIKYQGTSIKNIDGKNEKLSNETNINEENVKTFEETGVIKTKDYIAIVSKDGVIYDKNGKIKEIKEDIANDDNTSFSITNNTNEKIKYRVVIEQSNRTTVNTQYLRFQISNKSKYIQPTKLNDALWKEDYVSRGLNITGINYILIESSLEPFEADSINLMLWADYDTIPNSEQDKYFYGTIKVYAWTEE